MDAAGHGQWVVLITCRPRLHYANPKIRYGASISEVNLAMKKQSLHSQQTFTDMGKNTEDSRDATGSPTVDKAFS